MAKSPAIRLRIIVDQSGASVNGLEKVVNPLKRAMAGVSRQATKDFESLAKSVEKVMLRMQGFTMKGGKRNFTDLTDILKALQKINTSLSGISGKKFDGLAKAFGEMSKGLDTTATKLDRVIDRLGKLRAAGGGSAAGRGKRLKGVPQSLADQIDEVLGATDTRATGGLSAQLNRKNQITSMAQELANARLGARVRLNLGGRGASVSIASDEQLQRQAQAAMQSELTAARANAQRVRQNQQQLFDQLQRGAMLDASRQAAMSMVNQHGMQLSGTRASTNADGQMRTMMNYMNPKTKARLSLVQETGQFNAVLPRSIGMMEKLWGMVDKTGAAFKERLVMGARNFGAALANPLTTFSSFMIRLGAVLYTVRHLKNMFEAAFVTPLREGLRLIIESTEQYREFELSIAGIVGGTERAKEINMALVKQSQDMPVTIKGMQDIARQMGFITPLSSRLSLNSSDDAAKAISDFTKVVEKLSIFDPEQGERGVMIAMREAMAGEFRSLRQRLEISPALVAQSIGMSERDLAGSPQLTLQALKAYTNQFIPDEILQERGNLYSLRVEKLQEAFRNAAAMIGDSGVFNDIVDGLEKITRKLFAYMDTGEWKERAKAISANLSTILQNVGEAVMRFLRSVAGIPNDIGKEPEAMAKVMDGVVATMADLSKHLPTLGDTLGQSLNNIYEMISRFVGRMQELSDALDSPVQSVGRTLIREATIMSMVGPIPYFLADRKKPGAAGPATRPFAGARPASQPSESFTKFDPSWSDEVNKAYGAIPKSMREGASSQYWNSLFLSSRSNIHRLGADYEPDDFDRAVSEGNRTLESILFGHNVGQNEKGNVFDAARSIRNRAMDQFWMFRRGAEDQLEGEKRPGVIERLKAAITRTTDLRDWYDNQFGDTVRSLGGDVQDAAAKWGMASAKNMQGVAPEVRLMHMRNVMGGNTFVAKGMAKVLAQQPELAGMPINMGYTSRPTYEQMGMLKGYTDTNLEVIGRRSRFGADLTDPSSLQMSAAAIYQKAKTPLTEIQMQREQLNFLKSQVGEYQRVHQQALEDYNRAITSGNDALAETSLRTLQEARIGVADLAGQMEELTKQTSILLKNLISFGHSVEGALENSLGDAIYNLISGTGTLKDALLGFARDVTRAFSQMMANQFMASLFSNSLAAGGQGIFTSMFQGSAGSGNPFSGQAAYNAKAGIGVTAKATGGYLGGSFVPFAAFAGGGIANRPTLGLIAEAGQNEAVVPLPNGRSIPVDMRGAGGNTYVVHSRQEAMRQGYRPDRDEIIDLVASDIRKGGRVRKALTRRVG